MLFPSVPHRNSIPFQSRNLDTKLNPTRRELSKRFQFQTYFLKSWGKMPYKIPNDEWANPISIKLAYNWVNFTVSLSPFTYSFPSVALLLRSWFSIILFHSSIEFLIILRLLVGSFRVLYIMLFYLSKWWNVLSNYFWRIYRMHCLSDFFSNGRFAC